MKLIQIDGKTILEVSDLDLSILADNVSSDILDEDIIRRIVWILTHTIDECKKTLIENNSAIISKNNMIPSDTNALCQLIINDLDYKSRKQRDLEMIL